MLSCSQELSNCRGYFYPCSFSAGFLFSAAAAGWTKDMRMSIRGSSSSAAETYQDSTHTQNPAKTFAHLSAKPNQSDLTYSKTTSNILKEKTLKPENNLRDKNST
ncbi:unnamed protein product [Eretmochelys imbricata]